MVSVPPKRDLLSLREVYRTVGAFWGFFRSFQASLREAVHVFKCVCLVMGHSV